MNTILIITALDIGIIIAAFAIFSVIIPGHKRHIIWEKYISSFSVFVIYIFILTIVINIITAVVVYTMHYERLLKFIAPAVQSILVGFIAACVPRRGVGDKREEGVK